MVVFFIDLFSCIAASLFNKLTCLCLAGSVELVCGVHESSKLVIYAANPVILIIISFQSPTRSFIPYFKPSFSSNFFPTQPFFFLQLQTDYMIPQTFTATSEHIRFYFFSVFSCCFRAVD